MIADVFDALTSDRPYKKAFSLETTLEIMRKDKGVFFDPHLLDLFLDNLPTFLRIKEEFKDISTTNESDGNNEAPTPLFSILGHA